MTNKYTWEEQKKIVKDYFKLIRKKTMTDKPNKTITTDKEIIIPRSFIDEVQTHTEKEVIEMWNELSEEEKYLYDVNKI